MASLLPSIQARRGDETLSRARNLRDQFREVIPSDDMVSLQNRFTMYAQYTPHGMYRVHFLRA